MSDQPQRTPEQEKHLDFLIHTVKVQQDDGDDITLNYLLEMIPPDMIYDVMKALGRTPPE